MGGGRGAMAVTDTILRCDGISRVEIIEDALAWWNSDFAGVRLTDAGAFLAVEMAIEERAAAAGWRPSPASAQPDGGAVRPVALRLAGIRSRIVSLAAYFVDPDAAGNAFGVSQAAGWAGLTSWAESDIASSAHPMSGVPLAGQIDSDARQASAERFLADCKHWLLRMRFVDVTDLAWYSRRHKVDASHRAWLRPGWPDGPGGTPEDDCGEESINFVPQPQPSAVSSRFAGALAGGQAREDDTPGAGDAAKWPAASSVTHLYCSRSESAGADWQWDDRSRDFVTPMDRYIGEDARGYVYSGLNVRNPAPLDASVRVLLVPDARPGYSAVRASFTVADASDTHFGWQTVIRSRLFSGRRDDIAALYSMRNGPQWLATYLRTVGSSGDYSATTTHRRPDGSIYGTETDSGAGVSPEAQPPVSVNAHLPLPAGVIASLEDVIVRARHTAADVIPALGSVPAFALDSPVELPSMTFNSLREYSLYIDYSARAVVLLDYGDYYTFGGTL